MLNGNVPANSCDNEGVGEGEGVGVGCGVDVDVGTGDAVVDEAHGGSDHPLLFVEVAQEVLFFAVLLDGEYLFGLEVSFCLLKNQMPVLVECIHHCLTLLLV